MKISFTHSFTVFLFKSLWLGICFSYMGLQQGFAQCSQIDSLRRLEVLFSEKSDSKQLVKIYNSLSKTYASNSKVLAYKYAAEALNLAEELNNQEQKALALLNRGAVQYQVNSLEFHTAVKDFEKALSIFRKLKDQSSIASAYSRYARFYYDLVYTKRQYLDSAAKYYNLSYDIYTKINKKEEASEVAGLAAEAFFEKGDETKALEFSEKSINNNDIQFSKAGIIKRSLDAQIAAQNRNWVIGSFAFLGLIIFTLLLVRSFMQVQKANKLLELQKADLAEKNREIEIQKSEIEEQNREIQLAFKKLETQNKEIERQNKEILLQQTEIEMRNNELGEKNEELRQRQEEILSQRDVLENQAKELAEKATKLQRSNETVTILSRIGQTITSSLNFQEILNNFYVYTSQMMPCEGFVLAQYHLENGQIELKFSREFGKENEIINYSNEDIQNPIVWCIKNARNIWVNDLEDLGKFGLNNTSLNPKYNSMIFCPMLSDNQAIGAVGVYNTQEDVYNLQHLDMLKTLASYAAIALKNAETYEILNAAQEQLVEAEKMAALGGLVAGVAHEINTPVGICVTAASKLNTKTKEFAEIYNGGKMTRKDLSEYLNLTEEGTKILLSNLSRAADLVQGFKRVAVEQSTENQRVFNIKTYLEETMLALNPEFKNKPFEIKMEVDDIEINSYAGAFSQIITNLVMNSLIHGFKGKDHGKIHIEGKSRNKSLILTYQDDGNGMSKEVLSKIYEPFFTTNRDGGGTGLGMNIVYNLAVQKLGGKLNAESEPGNGVKFTFEIPLNMQD
jgi:signal transduction histidine kinase